MNVTTRFFLFLLAGLLHAAIAGSVLAFTVTDEQLARLGVELGSPVAVDGVEIAAAPARIVVPPAQQALVSVPVAGRVARLLVAEGETVTLGQTVAEVESPQFLEWQREYMDALVESELATAQRERDRELHEQGIIAERRLQETAAVARAANLRLEQGQQQLRIAGFSDQALEALGRGGTLATRLELRAPLAGVVLDQYVDVGARVDALDPVVRIGDLSTLWVELQLDQQSVARIATGMLAEVAIAGTTLRGTIDTIGQTVDEDTQAVLVRAQIANPNSLLKAGQFLAARIFAPTVTGGAFAVPAAAVVRSEAGAYLFVRSNAEFEAIEIEVVGESGATIYASGGVNAESQIAVRGTSALKTLWLSNGEGS